MTERAFFDEKRCKNVFTGTTGCEMSAVKERLLIIMGAIMSHGTGPIIYSRESVKAESRKSISMNFW